MKKSSLSLIFGFLLCSSIQASDTNKTQPSLHDGELAGHEYVDLGLPSGTLWATCNIGAEDYYYPGQYFAWGETQPRDRFIWNNYQFFEEEYTDSHEQPTYTAKDLGEVISGSDYDAASIQWGDAWRIPTKEDYEELIEYCDMEYWQEELLSPKKGLRIWGPNGNSILFPYTFSPRGGIDLAIMRGGEYWTATASETMEEDPYPSAMKMRFSYEGSALGLITNSRHDGFSIRPVIRKESITNSVLSVSDSDPSIKFEDRVFHINGYAEGCDLTLTDLSGRQVFVSAIDSESRLPVSSIPHGIYIATLNKDGKTISAIKIAIK